MSLSSPEMCVSGPRRCVYVRWYRAVAISGHGHLLSVQLAGDVSTTACPRSAGSASAEKLTYLPYRIYGNGCRVSRLLR
jgi:hypothetical protein